MSDPATENISPDEERPAFPDEEAVIREDVPASDAAIPSDELPVTQDDDPAYADLGAAGQGDLAPEDDPRLRGEQDGPDDLRTEV